MLAILDLLFDGLYLALFIRVILSWVPHDASHQLISFLYQITDPLLKPFQNIVPPEKTGGFDLSPIFAFIALEVVRKLLFRFII